MSRFLFTIAFLLAVVSIEILRENTKIPITALDVLFFPALPLAIYYSMKHFIFSDEDKKEYFSHDNVGESVLWPAAVCLCLVLPLALLGVWIGIKDPLGYFSGIKGAIHGYTAASLGMTVSGFTIYYVYKLIEMKLKTKHELS